MLSMRLLSTRVVPCLALLLAAAVPAGAEQPPTSSIQVAGSQLGNAGFSSYRVQFEQALQASPQGVEKSGRNAGEEENGDTQTNPNAAANGHQVASSPGTWFEAYVYGLSAWLSRAGSGRYTRSQGTHDATTPTPYRFTGAAGRAWMKPTGATSVVGASSSPSQTSQPFVYDWSVGLSQAASSTRHAFDTAGRVPDRRCPVRTLSEHPRAARQWEDPGGPGACRLGNRVDGNRRRRSQHGPDRTRHRCGGTRAFDVGHARHGPRGPGRRGSAQEG